MIRFSATKPIENPASKSADSEPRVASFRPEDDDCHWDTKLMEGVSTRRRRIVMAARKHRQEPLTALNHHLDLNWMVFDTVVHRQMLELLGRRVQDGVITRLVGKWLKAEI